MSLHLLSPSLLSHQLFLPPLVPFSLPSPLSPSPLSPSSRPFLPPLAPFSFISPHLFLYPVSVGLRSLKYQCRRPLKLPFPTLSFSCRGYMYGLDTRFVDFSNFILLLTFFMTHMRSKIRNCQECAIVLNVDPF